VLMAAAILVAIFLIRWRWPAPPTIETIGLNPRSRTIRLNQRIVREADGSPRRWWRYRITGANELVVVWRDGRATRFRPNCIVIDPKG